MRPLRYFFLKTGIASLAVIIFAQAAFSISTIEGSVYDSNGNPLSDIFMELLNDYGQMLQRTRTDGTGRYRFDGLSDGRYSVRAMAFNKDFFDETKPVNIQTQNIRGGEGSTTAQVDFYLKPSRIPFSDKSFGVIFVQEIPPNAKKAYETAVKELEQKRVESGFAGLNEAISLFPNYFDAIDRMGQELYGAKRYKEAVPFFLKASQINQKSITSLYFLGLSLHYLGSEYNKAALTALNQALIFAPGSIQVLVAVGTVERAMGKFTDSEKHLLLAKKMSKGEVAEVHKELAQLYANDLKRYKEAADELEAYLKASKAPEKEAKVFKKKIDELREKAKTQTN
jgi:tetratricopeptide (TPR) repeat protein